MTMRAIDAKIVKLNLPETFRTEKFITCLPALPERCCLLLLVCEDTSERLIMYIQTSIAIP